MASAATFSHQVPSWYLRSQVPQASEQVGASTALAAILRFTVSEERLEVEGESGLASSDCWSGCDAPADMASAESVGWMVKGHSIHQVGEVRDAQGA